MALILPNDIISLISKKLDNPSLVSFSRSCRQISSLCEIPIEYTWKTSDFSVKCAHNNYLNLLKWGYKNKFPFISDTISKASRFSGLKMVKYLHKKGCPTTENIIYEACFSGDINMINWLISRGYEVIQSCLSSAVESENYSLIKFIWKQYPYKYIDIREYYYALDTVCRKGFKDILMWFKEQKVPMEWSLLETSLQYCHFDIVDWLLEILPKENILDLNIGWIISSTKTNQDSLIDRFVTLIRKGYQNYYSICNITCCFGSIEFLRWIRGDNDTKYGDSPIKNINWTRQGVWESIIFERASISGNLDMIKWLLANGYSYTDQISLSQDMEILKWVIENNYPLSKDCLVVASREGSIEIVKFLLDIKFPYDPEGLLDYALISGKLELCQLMCDIGGTFCDDWEDYDCEELHLLKWANGDDVVYNDIRYKGCINPTTCYNNLQTAIDCSNFEMVDYLLSKSSDNLDFDDISLEYIFEHNDLEMLKFIIKKGFPVISDIFIDYIFNKKHVDINSWLFDAYPNLFIDNLLIND